MKGLCKFQVDIPKSAKVTAVQSLGNLHTFILRQPCWQAKECLPAHFPILHKKNFLTSLARNSVFIGPNKFKFGTKTRCMVL